MAPSIKNGTSRGHAPIHPNAIALKTKIINITSFITELPILTDDVEPGKRNKTTKDKAIMITPPVLWGTLRSIA